MGARSRDFTPRSRTPAPADDATQAADSALSAGAQLREWGLRPRKRFSQSFLTDQGIADAIVRAAELTPDDTVLEIGPGMGVLTRRLIPAAGRVVAVELDRDLAGRLAQTLSAPNLEVIAADALSFDPSTLGAAHYKLVANLPFHLTSPLLMRYLHDVQRPDLAIVMVQREVAERIAAPAGSLSYLAIAVQCVCSVKVVRQVPASAFYPRPKITSTVLELTALEQPLVPRESTTDLLKFVRAGFTQPRKRLANSLAQGLQVPKSTVEQLLDAHDLPETIRPHELPMETWRSLAMAWAETSR